MRAEKPGPVASNKAIVSPQSSEGITADAQPSVSVSPSTNEVAPLIGLQQTYPIQVQQADNAEKFAKLKAGLARLNHDVRTPANGIFLKVELAKRSHPELNNHETVEKFNSLFQKLFVSNKKQLCVLDHWCKLSEGEEANINSCIEYGKSSVEPLMKELSECVLDLCKVLSTFLDQQEVVSVISRTAPDLTNLVDNIIKGNDSKGNPSTVNPTELVKEAVGSLKGNWISLQMEIQVEQQGEVGLIHIDPAIFKSCIYNLVSNSAKACQKLPGGGDGTKCKITIETKDGSVLVSVKDSGPGIPAGIIDKIFDEGFSTSEGESKGTDIAGINKGLGLSSVREYVQNANGTIAATSPPGEGACFTITLPEVKNITEAKPVAQAQERRPSLQMPFSILLIDDNPDACTSLKMFMDIVLPKEQYLVKTAGSVKEALEIISGDSHPPHLIITDVNLRGNIRGPKIKPILEELGDKGIKVFSLSGESERDLKKEFPYLDGTLIKPIDPTELSENLIPRLVKEAFGS